MLTGGSMVFIWNKLIARLGGVLPYMNCSAFVLSCIAIVIVSLLTKKPDQAILDEFEAARHSNAEACQAADDQQ